MSVLVHKLSYKELRDKYGEPNLLDIWHKTDKIINFQVTPDIRVASKFAYKRIVINSLFNKKMEWLIIPRTNSKVLKEEVLKVRQELYKNKTASELLEIAMKG